MPTTPDVAVDEIVAVVSPSLVGIPTQYPNQDEPTKSAKDVWARVSIRHAEGSRATLGGKLRRQRYIGTVYIQFFFPVGTGSTDIYTTPKPTLDAIMDARTPGGVWFRDAVMYEGLADDEEQDAAPYFPMTVRASFTYDEIRG